jgi:hypothetical protein
LDISIARKGQISLMGFAFFLYIKKGELLMYKWQKTQAELDREAMLLAFGKGDINKYYYLKGKLDAELEEYIEQLKKIY